MSSPTDKPTSPLTKRKQSPIHAKKIKRGVESYKNLTGQRTKLTKEQVKTVVYFATPFSSGRRDEAAGSNPAQ